jgi:ABC-2 type transport system permease protein
MLAIYKRELRSYFTTPLGYVFVGIYLLVSGLVFCFTTLYEMSSDVTSYFSTMLLAFIVLLPILTMKLFAEEKKQRTEQLFMTAPVSLTAVVLGKFLSAYTLFAGSVLVSSLSFLLLSVYGNVQGGIFFGNLLALLLVGLAMLAVGTFVSAVTENQLSAAIITIAILAGLMLLSTVSDFITVYAIRFVFESLSIFYRFQNFAAGIFDFAALIYYLSVAALFLFLTVRVYDKRRFG